MEAASANCPGNHDKGARITHVVEDRSEHKLPTWYFRMCPTFRPLFDELQHIYLS